MSRETVRWVAWAAFMLGAVGPLPGQQAKGDPQTGKETKGVVSPSIETPSDSAKRAGSTEAGWLLFRGNANSTGAASGKLPAKLGVVWEHEIDQGAVEGTPIIVGGSQPRTYIGDLDGRILAFDLDSGKLEWEIQLPDKLGFVTAPAFRNNRLYIGDIDGIFHCFDMNGKELWKFTTDGEIDSSANFYKDLVLFGSQDSKLYALNADTGDVVWELETGDQVRCSATVIENRAFVAGCDGSLHIIDLDQGKEVGSVVIESPTGVTPAARGDDVFVGTEQAGFYAINWKTAQLKWKYDDPQGGLATRSCPAIQGKHVVLGANNRKVYSLNAETGQVNWTTVLKSKIVSSPVIVDGRVLVGSTDGRFYELNLETGEIVWQKELRGGIIGSPAVGFGRVVIATDRGVVYCLGDKDASKQDIP
ncbi:MAG: PQQ-binding-like beta-propeller repeat protein [Mariniblastus sp.]|nr:PQQ-binding-like beta-propeller repeat protein [Mariniblastus sp.]